MEDKMVGWHHQLNGHGFGWTPEIGNGQGGLACCGSWGHKELDTTKRLNNNKCYATALGGAICLSINIHEAGTCLDVQFPNPWAS